MRKRKARLRAGGAATVFAMLSLFGPACSDDDGTADDPSGGTSAGGKTSGGTGGVRPGAGRGGAGGSGGDEGGAAGSAGMAPDVGGGGGSPAGGAPGAGTGGDESSGGTPVGGGTSGGEGGANALAGGGFGGDSAGQPGAGAGGSGGDGGADGGGGCLAAATYTIPYQTKSCSANEPFCGNSVFCGTGSGTATATVRQLSGNGAWVVDIQEPFTSSSPFHGTYPVTSTTGAGFVAAASGEWGLDDDKTCGDFAEPQSYIPWEVHFQVDCGTGRATLSANCSTDFPADMCLTPDYEETSSGVSP